jgi:uncharacterized protein (DUF111 family)
MTGEEIATSCERLRQAAGALDVSLGSRLGKKGRPAWDVRLLVRPEALEDVIARCFAETATIGLRWRLESRRVLPRSTVRSPGGVRAKIVERPGGSRTAKAESDDLEGVDLAARRRLGRDVEADPGDAG